MSNRVVVIASGETERRSLPHLLAHLGAEGISLVEVRRPNGNRNLDVEMAEKLIKASWYALPESARPDKFVVLVDADGKDPDQILRPFRDNLAGRLGSKITASLQFAVAQWHLEAWYFADVKGIREYLGGRDPGNIDPSQPDNIQNPKLHLQNLLADRVYTAVISEEIARTLNVQTISNHSPSFREFVGAVRNGRRVHDAQEQAF
jgi:Domain of unknown function (DUF4276)